MITLKMRDPVQEILKHCNSLFANGLKVSAFFLVGLP